MTRAPSIIEVGKVREGEPRRVREEDKGGLTDLEGREDLEVEVLDSERDTRCRK